MVSLKVLDSQCLFTALSSSALSSLVLTLLHRNWDLHVTSSCHRVKIYSINRARPATAARLKQMEEAGASMVPITEPVPFDLETDEHYDQVVRESGGRDPEE